MEKLIGVVVLYNPNISELIENIGSYIDELDYLICIDNSTKFYDYNELSFFDGKLVIKNMNGNIGLARGLAYGTKYAIDCGATYIIHFDQDSRVKKGSVKKMYQIIRTYENYGIVSPNISLIYRENGKRIYTEKCLYDKGLSHQNWAITSGSIISKKTFELVGGIDEELFISGIDRDLSCRIINHGFEIIIVGNAILYQEAGNTKEINLFGMVIHPPYLNSSRYYYIFRNELYLRNKNGMNYKKCKTNLLKYMISILFFEEKKREKIQNVIKGIIDSKKMVKKWRNMQ